MPYRLLLLLFTLLSTTLFGARMVEKLDRGVVAIPTGSGNFISWRLQGYEPPNLGFNLYRNGTRLNSSPITGATNYTDDAGTSSSSYVVKAVLAGSETDSSAPVKPWGELTKRIPLDRPAGGSGYTYSPNDASVGDLDGDGQWDIVLKWDPSNSQDNANSGTTANVFLDGIKLDGTHLWRIDLGKYIRAGAHYTQFMVADFDGNGLAEIICKTGPGTRDATGNYLSKGPAASANHTAEYRNSSGYILSGPEFLTVFGPDGVEKTTVNYVPGRDPINGWGNNESYGNRVDRFLAAVAYLDGVHPSAVMQRGYYGRMTLAAWDWDGTTLKQRWFFDSNTGGNGAAAGQGNHNLSVGDVDGDGFDEIIEGSCAIDHDGKLMYATGIGHGDAIHLSDLLPDRPGLEVMSPHEEKNTGWPGTEVHDARTGEILWQKLVDNKDVGRGIAADISAQHRGFEAWSSVTSTAYNIATDANIGSKGSQNFRIYWDGDLQDELLDGTGNTPTSMKIEHWNGSGFDRCATTDGRWGNYATLTNNGTKANPCLVADILGDWREELIMRATTDDALILFSTTISTTHRIYTLMHDPVYRAAVAWQNVAYNQPPHLGFYIGDGVDKLPVPDIEPVGGSPRDCAGVEEGSASLDECGRCTGGTTGRAPCSGYIDGTAFCSADGIKETANSGYTGTGYLNLDNATGSSAVFDLRVTETATDTILLRFANGDAAGRPVSLAVNGEISIASLDMPATGSWTTWQLLEVPLRLTAGQNFLEITSLTGNGAANIDFIGLVSDGLTAGDCEPSAIGSQQLRNTRLASGMTVTLTGGDMLRISGTGATVAVCIADLAGRQIWKGAVEPSSGLSLKNLPRGVVLVQVQRIGTAPIMLRRVLK